MIGREIFEVVDHYKYEPRNNSNMYVKMLKKHFCKKKQIYLKK